MKIFITGATGFIGTELTKALLKEGFAINALYRDKKKINLTHRNLTYVKGDVNDPASLQEGMKQCDVVFHLAAFAHVWSKNKDLYQKVNVEGTKNILIIAQQKKVKKVVVVSTAGILGPSSTEPVTELSPPPTKFFTEYEVTKARTEEIIQSFQTRGLNIITIYPTRVYGPGIVSESNSATKMIYNYYLGRWHFLPGNGKRIGNYVFIEDLIHGMIKIAENNIENEKIILGGINIDYKQLFETISKVTGRKTWLIPLPVPVMLTVAKILELVARLSGYPPLITPGWVKKFTVDWKVSSAKAVNLLNYPITPMETALQKTIQQMAANSLQQ